VFRIDKGAYKHEVRQMHLALKEELPANKIDILKRSNGGYRMIMVIVWT